MLVLFNCEYGKRYYSSTQNKIKDLKVGNNKIIVVSDPSTIIINPPKINYIMVSLSSNQILLESWATYLSASIEKYEYSDNFFSLISQPSTGVYYLFIEKIVNADSLKG